MSDYIFLMHNDGAKTRAEDWPAYFANLRASDGFDGGSAIGKGACFRKSGATPATSPISGYIRVQAASLDEAKKLLAGNPVYEAGGTVEIRELPRE
jgi:hypothetical protein